MFMFSLIPISLLLGIHTSKYNVKSINVSADKTLELKISTILLILFDFAEKIGKVEKLCVKSTIN